MSKQKQKTAELSLRSGSAAWLCSAEAFDTLTCQGYTSLSHNPEITAR